MNACIRCDGTTRVYPEGKVQFCPRCHGTGIEPPREQSTSSQATGTPGSEGE